MKVLKPINQKSVFYSFDVLIQKVQDGEISPETSDLAGELLDWMTNTVNLSLAANEVNEFFNLQPIYLGFGETYQKLMNGEYSIDEAKSIGKSFMRKNKAIFTEIKKIRQSKSLTESQRRSDTKDMALKGDEQEQEDNNVIFNE